MLKEDVLGNFFQPTRLAGLTGLFLCLFLVRRTWGLPSVNSNATHVHLDVSNTGFTEGQTCQQINIHLR